MTKIIFSHLVEVDESNRKIMISRVFSDGRKQLYTEMDFPIKSLNEREEEYEIFFRNLGESILIDSPIARKIIDM
jgi:hypothetical protein